MSEFVEIGGKLWRTKEVLCVTPTLDEKRAFVKFYDGCSDTFNEPYESVRDKLLGKVAPKSDQFDVEEFFKWCDAEDGDGKTCGSGLSPLEDVRISRGIPAKELRDAIGYLIQAYMIDTGKMR